MDIEGIRFKQVQRETNMPEVSVTLWDDKEQIDYITLEFPEFCVKLDLSRKTFWVRAYDGL